MKRGAIREIIFIYNSYAIIVLNIFKIKFTPKHKQKQQQKQKQT